MDEYYCPNCGADLDDQSGFDPDVGTWTCTECGKLLMDDDVYDGNRFEGVAWYCDNCGALLNRQSGFSDNYDSWTCTECYHENSISEDDIYESEEDYRTDKIASKLSDSIMSIIENIFAEQDDLEDEDDSEDEDDLEDEDDSEDEDDLEDEEDEYEEEPSEKSQDSYSVEYVDCNVKRNCSINNLNSIAQEIDKETIIKQLKKKRLKALFFNKKKIKVEYKSCDLEGDIVDIVKKKLELVGFTKITQVPVYDIYVDSKYDINTVEKIVIAGTHNFVEADFFAYDAQISISYHVKRELELTYTNRNLRGLQYLEVTDKLLTLGFTEVSVYPIEDLVTGWMKKDGSVEQVLVAGRNDYKRKDKYPYDVKIVVRYHTFKETKIKH